MDIHRSGERTSSGPTKGATESGANWSHEGLTTEGKVKKIPSTGNQIYCKKVLTFVELANCCRTVAPTVHQFNRGKYLFARCNKSLSHNCNISIHHCIVVSVAHAVLTVYVCIAKVTTECTVACNSWPVTANLSCQSYINDLSPTHIHA